MQKVEAFSAAICNHLAARSKPVWQGRRVMILDGTTITLPPTPALKKAFPPAVFLVGSRLQGGIDRDRADQDPFG